MNPVDRPWVGNEWLLKCTAPSPLRSFHDFWPPGASLVSKLNTATLARWLDAQRGKEAVSTVARRATLSRYQVARILGGDTEPRLHQFFALLQACTGRLGDLIAECVDINLIETLRSYHERTTISRRLAFEEPWTSALLAALECLPEFEREDAERALAEALGLSDEEVTRHLRQMVQAGALGSVGRCARDGSARSNSDRVEARARAATLPARNEARSSSRRTDPESDGMLELAFKHPRKDAARALIVSPMTAACAKTRLCDPLG